MAAFEERLEELTAEGISVVAASVDETERARSTVDALGLTFPVIHSLSLHETAQRLTCFYETRRAILHATGFVIRPDRSIAVACYSTGPIGRLEPPDVLAAVRFWAAPPT